MYAEDGTTLTGYAIDVKETEWVFFETSLPDLDSCNLYYRGTNNLCSNCHQAGSDQVFESHSHFNEEVGAAHQSLCFFLQALLALPWRAPLLDARKEGRHGRRRAPILALQTFASFTLLGVAFLSPTQHMGFIFAAVLITNLLAATQDVATDGLAVDLLQKDERGWGNGIQVAGYRIGMILGGGVMLVLLSSPARRPPERPTIPP